MRVVVLGAGSLGSLVGGLLAAAGTPVTLLGRENEHLAAVDSDGLELVRDDGSAERVPVETSTDPAVAADADLLLVCVKSYDTADALAGVAAHLDDADVLTLQNGLGNAETIAEFVPDERVVVGTTTNGAVRERPGSVRHAGRGETTVGRYFAPNDDRVTSIADLLTDAGLPTTVTDDPRGAVWEKVLVNVGVNAPTALARVRNGALAETNAGERLVRRAVEEGRQVARAEGVTVTECVAERALDVARTTGSNRSSMRQDLEAGRRTEIEALNGELVGRGREHEVPVPVNETLADLVRLASGE